MPGIQNPETLATQAKEKRTLHTLYLVPVMWQGNTMGVIKLVSSPWIMFCWDGTPAVSVQDLI